MHEGYWSAALGLRGWPASGEELIVARNILLAELTGARVHCQHMSAAGSVQLLREAKKRGVPISGEACPHHFTLTDTGLAGSEKFWGEDGRKSGSWPAAKPSALAGLRHEFQDESAVALRRRPRGNSGGTGGRHAGDHQQRSRAALRLMRRKWNSTTRRLASSV